MEFRRPSLIAPGLAFFALAGIAAAAGAQAVDRAPEQTETFFGKMKQLTFGGQNAEAYFSGDGKRLILQRMENDSTCDQEYTINISFGSNPDRTEELVKTVMKEIESFKANGPTDKQVADVKDYRYPGLSSEYEIKPALTFKIESAWHKAWASTASCTASKYACAAPTDRSFG